MMKNRSGSYQVIKPLIERRWEITRTRIIEQPEKAEEYEKKQELLKWLLVTSFGYMDTQGAIWPGSNAMHSIQHTEDDTFANY